MTTETRSPPPEAQKPTRGQKPIKARWVALGWNYAPLAVGYKLSRLANGIDLAVVTGDGEVFAAVIGGRVTGMHRSETLAKQSLLEIATRRGLV